MARLGGAAMAVALLAPGLLTAEETTSRHSVSLVTESGTVSTIVLTNTHTRSYNDPSVYYPSPSQCVLSAKAAGVVWKIVCKGAKVPANDVKVTDEKGVEFVHVCWSSSGDVYDLDRNGNRTGGGPQTELLAAGPESPTAITVSIAGKAATISLPK